MTSKYFLVTAASLTRASFCLLIVMQQMGRNRCHVRFNSNRERACGVDEGWLAWRTVLGSDHVTAWFFKQHMVSSDHWHSFAHVNVGDLVKWIRDRNGNIFLYYTFLDSLQLNQSFILRWKKTNHFISLPDANRFALDIQFLAVTNTYRGIRRIFERNPWQSSTWVSYLFSRFQSDAVSWSIPALGPAEPFSVRDSITWQMICLWASDQYHS